MPTPSTIDITARDRRLLRALYESRFLTLSHITALFFEGKAPAAQQRVLKLKRDGFVREQVGRKTSEPARISLTRAAFEYLTRHELLAGYPMMRWDSLADRLSIKPETVAHEVAVLDVRVAIERGLAESGLDLLEYSTWPRLFTFSLSPHPSPENGDRDSYALTPDSLIRFRDDEGTSYTFFVEVDRSSEDRARLLEKALAYKVLQAEHQALLRSRLGGPTTGAPIPIAALFVFQSRADGAGNSRMSRNNFIERVTARTNLQRLIYAATFEDATRDPLGSVWLRPKEYRAALAGTPYDPADMAELRNPPRRPERDRLVDERVRLVNPFGQ